MRAHFIAIGGSAMHNLAIALHHKGYKVTGSDDEIFEPSRSRLDACGILPKSIGWDDSRVTPEIEAVVLGMHAREDNPELRKARELGLKIYSYPEFLYEATKDKIRIVIGGSHGKTSITSMIMHVFKTCGMEFDYMVGAQLEGFDTMVNLSNASKYAVFEGDEYLASTLDPRPKFHLYRPNIALISGIAWDHINVFPTFEIYIDQFRIFTKKIEKDGSLIYCANDNEVVKVANEVSSFVNTIPYSEHPHKYIDGKVYLTKDHENIEVEIFGSHNMQNLSGAQAVCKQAGISDQDFYKAIATFKGAAKRLQLLGQNDQTNVYLDFAHSPSKLQATLNAVIEKFLDRKLTACMELHTFSSLTEEFLLQYNGTMERADVAYVYFNPHTIEHKKLKALSIEQVAKSFGSSNVKIFTDSQKLRNELLQSNWNKRNLLLMTSGNFDGINFAEFSKEIVDR